MVEYLDLKRALRGHWFNRLVLITWIISGVCIFIFLKNIEFVVHGQLYNHGLLFSSEWADPYNFFAWGIYLSLGLPIALSGIALASAFLQTTQKLPEKKTILTNTARSQPHVSKPTPHVSKPTPHVSKPTPHVSKPTPHVSKPTPHVSKPTPHVSKPTPHVSSCA
jgi:hypothetical protein